VKRVKTAVVGCGIISHVYLRNMTRLFSILDVVAVCDLIPELAQKPGAVNRDQILALYVAGCPKAMLCRGAEAMTVESWRRNIEDLFPEWTELPEPVNLVLPSGLEWLNVLLIGNAILLALASLLPAGLMLAMDAFLMLPCLIVAGVLVVAALLLLVISFPVRKKAQKLYLRIMAASMVPGIVATVVCLVMNMK